MVARLTPSSRAMEETVLSGRVSRSRAWRISSAVMAGGRPSRTPRASAASRPSRVPSTISSRMNSASAAKTWKTSRPPGVVVSSTLVQALEADTLPAQRADDLDQVGQGPGQPVQARHGQGVAGPQVVQAGRQLGPVGVLARELVGEDAEAARPGQGVLLAVEQLARGADPSVADQGVGPHGRFGGEKAAGASGVSAWGPPPAGRDPTGCVHGRVARGNLTGSHRIRT